MPMELGGQQYTAWKNELIMIERYILKELGFSLYNIMDHPHKYILYFIKVLNGSEALANEAWSYLNDSMRLDVSLKYEAQTIACAAIYLAAHKVNFALPEDAATGVWWEVFGAETADMDKICSEILGLYQYNKVSRVVAYSSYLRMLIVFSVILIAQFGWLEPLAEVEYLSADTCAAFDKVLAIETPPVVHSVSDAQPASSGSLTGNVRPFGSASPRVAAAGGSTPTGDGSATPVSGNTPVRATATDCAEEVGGGAKLARKWFSVVGDIDKLDDPAANEGTKATEESVRSSRPSTSKGRETVPENTRDRSRARGRSDRRRDDSRDRSKNERRGDSRSRQRSSSRDRGHDRNRSRGESDRRPAAREENRDSDRDKGYRDSRSSRPRSRSREGGSRRDRDRDAREPRSHRSDSRSPKRRRP